MTAESDWYEIENVADIDSPALVIYLDRVKHNIQLAISMIGDVSRLRPHVKTHKTKEATLLMTEAGITKFKCATIAEAEMLAMCNAPDVLLAYQPVGPKLNRFIALLKRYSTTRFSCLVDNSNSAPYISENAVANNVQVDVFIDLNVGQNRTGILPGAALKLFRECDLLRGINMVGVHAYDGHIYEPDFAIRTLKANEAFSKVDEVRKQLIAAGLINPIIVVGGSPTFPIHAKRPGIECSPGTFVYWDKGYSDSFPEMKFQPAALVLTRVISLLDDTHVCLDLGHKSIAPENNLEHRVSFLDEDSLKLIGQNEEHLVVQLPVNHKKKVGDVLYGMPFHICPTCALYDTATVIENHKVKDHWKIIARDRKITI
jgi:D-serine deaminase-like pyridoxal phosphate-dependent protein